MFESVRLGTGCGENYSWGDWRAGERRTRERGEVTRRRVGEDD